MTAPTSPAPRGDAAAREQFLGSSRALLLCAREVERVSEGIARRAAQLGTECPADRAEVRRTPARCIVQLGPVALTVSWVSDRAHTAASGRLMVGEWRGVVARGTPGVPERAPVGAPPAAATLLREAILVADATGEADWRWRREDAPDETGACFTSAELATLCVDSLLLRHAEHRTASAAAP